MTESLINKYRPQTWDDFIGNEEAITSIRKALDEKKSRSFLFTGGAGQGKTSIARVAAKHVGTRVSNIIEIDGATHTGIDHMREIMDELRHVPFGGGIKSVIVDECHRISGNAWDSLLKMVEEPPEYVYWFFCTTNLTKVPDTIRTRSLVYVLKNMERGELRGLLEIVAESEGVSVAPSIIDMCVKEAYNSPRRGLSLLAQTMHCTSREEAAKTIGRLVDDDVPVQLIRLLLDPKCTWESVCKKLDGLKDDHPESIRHICRDYLTKVLLNKEGKEAWKLMPLLDELLIPFPDNDGISPLVAACARWLFNKPE